MPGAGPFGKVPGIFMHEGLAVNNVTRETILRIQDWVLEEKSAFEQLLIIPILMNAIKNGPGFVILFWSKIGFSFEWFFDSNTSPG